MKELYCHKEWPALEGSTSAQSGLLSPLAGSRPPGSLLPNCQALPSLHADPDACTHVPLVGKTTETAVDLPSEAFWHVVQKMHALF